MTLAAVFIGIQEVMIIVAITAIIVFLIVGRKGLKR